jgi:type IV pilus assembly protein PilC
MKRFKYKAKDKKGQLVTGEVEASSKNHAAKLIRNKELVVISLKPAAEPLFSFLTKYRERVTHTDITNFTRQISTMINAGLPINEALLILRAQSAGAMQKIAAQILTDVEGGESLSTAMSRHPKVFSPTYISLVKSGEAGGVLSSVLARLADSLERQREFQGRVKGALIYPAIIVVGMLIVGLIMMIFVIPKMLSLYEEFEAELPLMTKVLIAISGFISRFWLIFIVIIVVAVYGLKIYKNTEKGRKQVDGLILKIPLIGELNQQVLLAELTSTLSLMVSSGVSILEGLNISAGVVKNSVMSDALKDSAKMVEKGFPVAYSFAKHPEAFPFIVSQMVAVGEETGKLDEVLQKVSHVFETESNQKVKTLTAAVEPLVLILLGLGVAFLVIAIILPIYNLTTQL